jgi:hypothetical protein
MEILANADFLQLGFVALMAFGSVGAVSFFYKKLTSGQKFLLLAAFAFAYGFVPADLGNMVAERVKEAIAVATSITALYTGLKVVGGK